MGKHATKLAPLHASTFHGRAAAAAAAALYTRSILRMSIYIYVCVYYKPYVRRYIYVRTIGTLPRRVN